MLAVSVYEFQWTTRTKKSRRRLFDQLTQNVHASAYQESLYLVNANDLIWIYFWFILNRKNFFVYLFYKFYFLFKPQKKE